MKKRCGRDNSIYHPLGIFLRLFFLSLYTLGLTFFPKKSKQKKLHLKKLSQGLLCSWGNDALTRSEARLLFLFTIVLRVLRNYNRQCLQQLVARKCRRSLQRTGCEWQALLAPGGVNIPRTFSLKQSNLHWISFLWCNKLKVTFCKYYMQLFLKIRNRLLILVHSKFLLSQIPLLFFVIKRSSPAGWGVKITASNSIYKHLCGYSLFHFIL